MIKHFKKGSYKMSAMSIAVLTLLGSVTVASADNNILNPSTDASVSQNVIKKDDDDFKLSDTKYEFDRLDRVHDFVNFEFKVPTYLPSEYNLLNIIVNGVANGTTHRTIDNLVSINFVKDYTGYFAPRKQFEFLVSNETLVPHLKDIYENYHYRSSSNEAINVTVNYSEEPMTISNVNGINLTIKSDHIAEEIIENFGTDSQKVVKLDKPKEKGKKLSKYFIWNNEGIWYGVQYYHKYESIDSPENNTYFEELQKNDIEQMVLSLTNSKNIPKDIYKDKYTSVDEHYDTGIRIYNKKDLIRKI
ncbi:hypothetical protein [Gottschalkia acidurici]|nr:hypothetical protein [Gottschalkia acidurici]